MIPRDSRDCKAGITLWAVRTAIREELAENQRFRELVDAAIGGGQIQRIHAIKRLGCRYDLLLETETSDGAERRIVILAALDEPADPDPRPEPLWITTFRRHRGHPSEIIGEDAIALRFAPRLWFQKRKIACGLTFEEALPMASKTFRSVLREGIARCKRELAPVRKRRDIPIWVLMQGRR
ncbi:MAG: hypothetical protein JWM33_663 [Caulobacteraceae bacterium]|nr:hypothetical protein [Caulobacteraceae bacterium]